MGPRPEYRFGVEDILAVTSAVIRKWGWVSRAKVSPGYMSTSDAVWNIMTDPKADKVEIEDKDKENAQETIAWIGGLEGNLNDYMHNLQTIFKRDYVNGRSIGFAVSAVPSYYRYMERELVKRKAAADSPSEFVGSIKERITFEAIVMSVRSFEGTFDTVHLHKFKDAKGNLFAWFASNDQELGSGDEITITGTVKSHNEFHGIKETIITRCKVVKKEIAS